MSRATLYDVDAGVATITLNQPESSNALSAELINDLGDDLGRAMQDAAVRAIVLTNNGRAFCAGADLRSAPGSGGPRYSLVDVLTTMLDGPKPVIGRIAGHCMGGGVGLAAACDISVAADDVRFGFTEVRIGVAPAIISVVVLPKMRRADAMELFLSGERVTAARAAEVGLVNRAVARDEIDAAVGEIVQKVVAGGPAALAAAKRLVVHVPGMDRGAAFEWTAELSAGLSRARRRRERAGRLRDERRPYARR